MIRQLTDSLRPRSAYQTTMYLLGSILMLSAVFHLGVFLADGGSWWGAVSWRKPTTFGFSLGISVLFYGWIQGLLPRHALLGWLTTVLAGVFSVLEVGLITMQRWRGVPSHFNNTTYFDGMVWIGMAIFIGLVTLGILILAVWVAFKLRGSPSTLIATLTGLGLLLFASAIGGDLVGRGQAAFEATGSVPESLLIGMAGSGKLAHAAGIHGLQVLGGLAIVLPLGTMTESRRTRLMTLAAVAYTALTGLIVFHAYGGSSMLDVGPMALGLIGIFVLVIAFTLVTALRSWMGSSSPTRQAR